MWGKRPIVYVYTENFTEARKLIYEIQTLPVMFKGVNWVNVFETMVQILLLCYAACPGISSSCSLKQIGNKVNNQRPIWSREGLNNLPCLFPCGFALNALEVSAGRVKDVSDNKLECKCLSLSHTQRKTNHTALFWVKCPPFPSDSKRQQIFTRRRTGDNPEMPPNQRQMPHGWTMSMWAE